MARYFRNRAGKFFTDLAFSLTVWTTGAPAKAAVVSVAILA
jgi:TRAP-type uncharacterized transport system fused permease subunit